jgi:hypothetical protein
VLHNLLVFLFAPKYSGKKNTLLAPKQLLSSEIY